MEEKKYPIGGYAPGNYHCNCCICGSFFHGDKRAVQCEPCAVAAKALFDALSPDEQATIIANNVAAARAMFSKWDKPGLPPLPEPILTDKDAKDWEGEKRQTGAVWVRASEPPTHERYIPIRFADGTYKVAAFTTDHMLKERQPYWMYSRHDPINTLLEFEWYNDESGTTAGREEDAVAFAEWAGWDWRRVEGKSLWENQKTLEVMKTAQLYEQFKQQKEKLYENDRAI